MCTYRISDVIYVPYNMKSFIPPSQGFSLLFDNHALCVFTLGISSNLAEWSLLISNDDNRIDLY